MRRPRGLAPTLVALAVAGGLAVPAPAAAAPEPDDPLYEAQWGHRQVNAPQAWLSNRGDGVLVAVVDTGVDLDHPDLAGRVVPGRTFLECGDAGCGDGGWQSGPDARRAADSSHGTHVAGIVAAVADNATGVAGVAPASRILTIKALDADGGTTGDLARSIDFARESGAAVVNLSLGTPVSTPTTDDTGPVVGPPDPVVDAIDRATAAGVLVVASAGNEALPLCDYPAVVGDVVCVASNDRRELHSAFSNFGSKPDQLALTGPGGSGQPVCGEDVLSTVPPGSETEVCGYGPAYTEAAGTSFSTPHVSAAAALLIAQGRTRAEVVQALVSTARTPGGEERGTYDPVNGYGIVDAAAAVASARRAGPASPETTGRGIADACPPGQVPPQDFADVVSFNIHRDAIACLVAYEVTRGFTDDLYAPTRTVSREAMTSFLARLLVASGATLPSSPPDAFDDDDGGVHEANTNRLAAVGIVQGSDADTFRPEEPVTREQMASFLVRTYEHRTEAVLTAPADAFDDDDGGTHEENTNRAAEAGFTGGVGGRDYRPTAPVLRDQMATFLARVLDLLVENRYSATPF